MFSQRRTRFLSDSEKHFASLFFNGHDVYYIYWSLLYLLTFELHRLFFSSFLSLFFLWSIVYFCYLYNCLFRIRLQMDAFCSCDW